MAKKGTAPVVVATETAKQKKILKNHTIKNTPRRQPGTALVALLKKYKFDLLQDDYTRHISMLLDCVDTLINERESHGR